MSQIINRKLLEDTIGNLLYLLFEQGELSNKLIRDRHYSFWQFYELRTVLLEIIANSLPGVCSKSEKHSDGTMFNDDFILIIDTLLGTSTHHLKKMYFEDMHVLDVDHSPIWDEYTPEDNLNRLGSIIVPKNYIQTEESIPYKSFIPTISEDNEKTIYHINALLEELRKHNKIDLNSIGDGHHSFEFLYRQRRVLLKLVCQLLYGDLAYVSQFDISGIPFPENKFVLGIKTPEGDAFQVLGNQRFKEFNLPILECAPVDSRSIITQDHKQLDILHEEYCRKILSLKIRKYYE